MEYLFTSAACNVVVLDAEEREVAAVAAAAAANGLANIPFNFQLCDERKWDQGCASRGRAAFVTLCLHTTHKKQKTQKR